MVYLCKYCETVANYPLTGLCQQSPTEQHECLTGDEIEEYIRMAWDRVPADLTKVPR